jgi:type I site-specific restriction endonuclease
LLFLNPKGEAEMKYAPLVSTVVLVSALTAFTPAAFAVEEHHQKEGAAQTTTPSEKDVGKTTQRMQENIKKMEQQMDRIRKTKDPAEREGLLQEHMQTMRENMMMGKGMMGGGMSQGMMDCPMMGEGMSPDAMANRMQHMEKRMDMMQMMMEQMHRSRGKPAPK